MLNLIFHPLRTWRRWQNDKSRRLFVYFDGERMRRIDPVEAMRSLFSWPEFDWYTDPQGIDDGDERALQATLAAVRGTFAVPVWSEHHQGLNVEETIGLLLAFVRYITDLKKSGNGLLITPRSTARAAPSTANTKPSSDCGSTSIDSNCEPPLPESPLTLPVEVDLCQR